MNPCLTCGSDDISSLLGSIRGSGWVVAVHNDYRLDGKSHTFWLFTNEESGRFIKGEGLSDFDALKIIYQQICNSPKINLSVDQWASFGRDVMGDPKKSALQSCCSEIANLRDTILNIAANDGVYTPKQLVKLSENWRLCCNSHVFNDEIFKTLHSLITQAGLPWSFK